jgi:DNA-binding transcriptional MocR family regulator
MAEAATASATDPRRARLYLELAARIEDRIRDGTFRPGEKVPSVRTLGARAKVSTTTVLAAYRTLESKGLIRARPKSGYYVLERPEPLREPDASRPATHAFPVDLSLAVQLNLGIGDPKEPTFGAAVQGAELMPIAAINRHLNKVLRHEPVACHSYDAPPGSEALRCVIARRGIDAGYRVSPDEIVITSGAKEAVYLSICATTRPGDTVAVESPTYYALLEVLASRQLKAVEVASHPRQGIDLDDLERVLATHRPSAIALVSNFSNPTGACMSDEAKRRLVELVDAYDVPLVEDDVYGDLAFDGARPKALKAFDRTGRVLYCASYSKTLSPGLRVGWVLPGRYQAELELLKLVVNQATPTAAQLAIASFVDSGGLDRHLRRVRHMYAEQMERAIDAVLSCFPPGTRTTRPQGGHVLWVQLPEQADALALYHAAAAVGISFAPGPMFSASGGYRDFLRLNTGFPWTSRSTQRIKALGRLVADQLDDNGRARAG